MIKGLFANAESSSNLVNQGVRNNLQIHDFEQARVVGDGGAEVGKSYATWYKNFTKY